MVKSKKLSRGSLAVLLLALMLALSMVVGITGAWFTDAAQKNDATTGSFGTVSIRPIQASEYKLDTAWSGTDNEKILPGSSINVSGGTVKNDGNVNIYVKLDLDTKITFKGVKNASEEEVEFALTDVVSKANGNAVSSKTLANYFNWSALAIHTGQTAVTGSVATLAAGHGVTQMYDLAPNGELVVDGFSVSILQDLPNSLEVTHESTTYKIVFNLDANAPIAMGAGYVNAEQVKIAYDVHIAAVQKANWTNATKAAGEGSAEAFLETILASYASYEAHKLPQA